MHGKCHFCPSQTGTHPSELQPICMSPRLHIAARLHLVRQASGRVLTRPPGVVVLSAARTASRLAGLQSHHKQILIEADDGRSERSGNGRHVIMTGASSSAVDEVDIATPAAPHSSLIHSSCAELNSSSHHIMPLFIAHLLLSAHRP